MQVIQFWVPVLVLAPTVSVTLDRFLNLPEPPFPHLKNTGWYHLAFHTDVRIKCGNTREMLCIVPRTEKGLHIREPLLLLNHFRFQLIVLPYFSFVLN